MAKLKDPLAGGRINLPPVDNEPASASEQEVIDDKLEAADRTDIDKIILSNDVQKGGKIRVTLKRPLDQSYGYLVTIPAEQWDTEQTMETLKQQFGGGHYKCQTFRSNGQMYKSFDFSIDSRFKGSIDVDVLRANQTDGKQSSDTKTLVEALMRKPDDQGLKSTDLIKIFEMNNQRSDQSNALMMTMMMKSMETSQQTMAAMMAAMVSAKSGGGTAAPDITAILLEMIKTKQDRPPMMEMLEQVKMMKEVFGNEPKEEKEEGMLDKIFKVAGPVIAGLAQSRQVQQPAAAAQLPPGETPRPRVAGMMNLLPAEFKILLQMGLRAAEKNSDPAIYFDLMVDQLTENQFAMMKSMVQDNTWCAKLFGSDEAVAHIRPWLEDLRNMILEYGTETHPVQEQSAGDQPVQPVTPIGQPAGPASDTGDDGASGDGGVS